MAERTPQDDTTKGTETSCEGVDWHHGPHPAFGFMTTHVGPRERCTGPDCEPEPDDTTEDPFDPAPTGWRAAPDCDRCKDTGRYRETNAQGGVIEAHCGCKQGRRASELWYADKHGLYHPDEPEPSEPDFEEQ